MIELTQEQAGLVSGAGEADIAVAVAIAYVTLAYQMGKDLAQRNAQQCH